MTITQEQIARINELYKKKNDVGLTEEELNEQTELRKLYINSFKQNLKAQLDTIKVVTPEEYEKLKENGHGHEHEHGKDCGCHNHNHNHNHNHDHKHGKDCGCHGHKH